MSPGYYRLLLGFAASLSLILAGCGSGRPVETAADPVTGAIPAAPAASRGDDDETDATLWTVLGPRQTRIGTAISGRGPGDAVSPILWQATHDTLNFAGIARKTR